MTTEPETYPPTPAARVLDAAIEIARAAPRKQHHYAWSAQIPWTLIHELRGALTALDIPWQGE